MHSIHFFAPLLLACGLAWGQTPAAAPASAPSPNALRIGNEARTEHIEVQDSAARIDEVRLGGETQSISVQPKNGMPAYQVAPKTGERTWKILGF